MAIKHIISAREKDLGGFSVRRLLPIAKQRMVGPWIFFDHMGPAHFPAGKGIDVRPHPHINLATVTYLFEGEIFHRDSLGSAQAILPGDINLMVAGSGIVHSEREREAVRDTDHTLHGLQLWHALPETFEETDPAFYHYPADELPKTCENNVPLRVMIGSAFGLTSPVKTFCETLYIEAQMRPGDRLPLPQVEELAIYVASGSITVAGKQVCEYEMVVLEDNTKLTIEAGTESQIALIGGEKMPERFIDWNFVSSNKARIEKAKQDWQNQSFPKVPGDDQAFIPLP